MCSRLCIIDYPQNSRIKLWYGCCENYNLVKSQTCRKGKSIIWNRWQQEENLEYGGDEYLGASCSQESSNKDCHRSLMLAPED